MNNNDINYMFWTGGWDSTFMLIQELKKGKAIQPIYVVDEGRNGRYKELEAMNCIVDKIQEKDFFGGTLLSIIQINKRDIDISPEEHNAYKKICETIKLGTQYEWLAPIARKYGMVGMGIEKPNGEFSGCVEAMNTFGELIYKDGCGRLDETKSNDSIKQLFGNINFPIITLTENDMLQKVKEWDVEDIMKEIWFCHKPIKGQACGFCRPCQQKMECNMQFLLSEEAQKRYYSWHKIKEKYGELISKVYDKIYRIFVK